MSETPSKYPVLPNTMLDEFGTPGSVASPFRMFAEIVEDYRAWNLEFAPDHGLETHEIHELLCPNGVPLTSLDGQELFWRTGLTSLFSVDRNDAIGDIAERHQSAMVELYKRWSDCEGEPEIEPMYRDIQTAQPSSRPETNLAPALHNSNREMLSDFYVNTILRPYERATIACRKTLWWQLGTTHKNGAWVGFKPSERGRYVPILPGTGFDQKGEYRVSRKTYLKGFSYADNEIGHESFSHSSDYAEQENWVFLCVSELSQGALTNIQERARTTHLSDVELEQNAQTGRPRGSGFRMQDEPFVTEGVGLLASGQANSALAAATTLVKKYGNQIPGDGTFESKVKRLARAIRKRFRQS